ncbi:MULTISPECIES: DMT family transporter [unclassified Polaromonas]|uniref:DMT family transporter n=1 Tax=unclassified Polaromonas TaxID=2638319 RepID=UPI0018CAE1D3|nr:MULTISPECIES: DMT family transporter [unclassified Polaromonas]MBG6073355.1 drug/metabolite transporter (DMT)-like permease [Polaromonas sp. CG_9.7]MBG6115305.1 drug/metabolite transporter (DMT)-like permease [Polaromonas sp. CG_9.2]MDH6182991.1 drug/metabolite transporter (DMT)-like permease [Polaromonas sp. CG_23.6]
MAGSNPARVTQGRAATLAACALVLNAFVWGVSWWPFRQLQGHGVHPLWATAFIFVFSLLCLLAVRPGAWRGFLQHPMLWLLLAASGLTNLGFNWAVTTGDVVRVVLLFYLMPAWVVLLAWPMLGEKPGAGSLLRLALALAGLVVVLKTPASPWPVPESLADWLAIMGGFTFALTNILLRQLNHTPGESRILAMFGGGALMATGTAAIGTGLGLMAAPPAPGVAWIGVTVLLSLAFLAGNLALQYGASRLRASTTSLIMLSEVVFASASSVLLGAGELSPRTLFGGGLILLAVLLATGSSQTD